MVNRSWLKGISPRKRPSRVLPRLEALEGRLAPATLDVTGGTLTYTAGPNVRNDLHLSLANVLGVETYSFSDNEVITLTQNAMNAGFTGTGSTASGPASSVTSLSINLGNNVDAFTLGAADAPLAPLSVADGGTAGDTATINLGGGTLTVQGALSLSGFDTINLDSPVSAANAGAGNISLGANAQGTSTLNVAPGATLQSDGQATLTGPGGISLAANVTAPGGILVNGPLTLQAALTLNGGTGGVAFAGAVTAGTNNLTVVGDTIGIGSTLTGTGSALTLEPATAGRAVNVSDNGTPNSLSLPTAALGNVSGFSSVFIGSLTGTGALTVVNPVTFTAPLTLAEGGSGGTLAVNGTVTDPAGSLTLSGSGSGTTLSAGLVTGGFPVLIQDNVTLGVANVTLDTTGAGVNPAGANVTITGTVNGTGGGLTVLAGTGGDVNFQGAVGNSAAPQSLTVTGGHNLTFTGTLQTTGNVTQTAGQGTTTLNGTSGPGIGGALSVTTHVIDLNSAGVTAGAAFLNGSGGVTLGAGLSTGAGNITLTGDPITLNGPVVTTGTVTLTDTGTNGVSQSVTGTLHAGGLLLQDQGVSGAFPLNQSNAVATLAAAVHGTLSFTDTQALTVGTLGGVAGVNTNGNNLTLAVTGLLTLGDGSATAEALAAGAATVVVNASGVTENTNSQVQADDLDLTGVGFFSLPQANLVTILAANVTGALSFTNAQAMLVGVINGTAGVNTNGNNLTLTTSGLLTLGDSFSAENLTAAGAAVSLRAAGVAQSADSVITSSSLSLQGTGTFSLTQANAVATLAAIVSGDLSFTDSQALTLGLVNGTAGVISYGADLTLSAGGLLTLGDGSSTAENLTAPSANVVLSASGVTENTNATVTAKKLGLLGTGAFSLPQANLVNILAANVTGTLAFTNARELIVGAVGGMNGINTHGSNLALTVSGGLLALGDATSTQENVAAATVDLNTTGLFENSNSVIIAGNLRLQGGTGFMVNQPNQVGTLAADVTEQLAFTNSQALTVGSVLGTNGLNGNGANLALAVAGLLTLGDGSGTAENVGAAGAGFFVTAGGINEANNSAVTAFGLVLTGTGSFSLTGANGVALLAANVTGALNFTDGQPLIVGAITSTVGLNTHGGNLGLTVAGGLLALGDGGGSTEDLTAAGATVSLNAAGIFENGNSVIVAQGLLLQGSVGFEVNQANQVGTLAGSVSAPLNFSDAQALTIGQVGGINGLNMNGANVALTTTGLLTLGDGSGAAENLTAAGAGVFLNTAGLAEAGNAHVSAFTMSLGGTGTFSLPGANSLSTLAATVTGSLAYNNTGSLITLGLSTGTGNSLTLATGGLLALGDGSGTAEPVLAPGATVDILAPGVFQSPNGPITAAGLRLRGGSSNIGFTLNHGNAVGTLAASIVNSLAFEDTQALTVGSVLGTTGVVTASGSVTFIADSMSFGAAVQGTGTLFLQTLTASRNVLIAPATPDPNSLDLLQSDINNIVGHQGGQNPAGFTMVVIGQSGPAYTGAITVANPVTFSTSVTLLTGGTITGSALITVPSGDSHNP